MAWHIHHVMNNLTQIKLCVMTDGTTTVQTLPQDALGDIPITRSLWDIVTLHRLNTEISAEEKRHLQTT